MSESDCSPAEISGPSLRCVLGVASFGKGHVGIQNQAVASASGTFRVRSWCERTRAGRSASRPAAGNELPSGGPMSRKRIARLTAGLTRPIPRAPAEAEGYHTPDDEQDNAPGGAADPGRSPRLTKLSAYNMQRLGG